jgi:hypothetical protein
LVVGEFTDGLEGEVGSVFIANSERDRCAGTFSHRRTGKMELFVALGEVLENDAAWLRV